MGKKIIVAVSAAILLVAICAAPALARGYNNGGVNFKTNPAIDAGTYGGNAGVYVREPASSSQTTSVAGPHGNYDSTTNKCQDCHSTHYATGTYMLLRADSRTQACDFCHAGGGGSKTNIQMDNTYNTTSTIASTDMGKGTGHSLGYAGNAPAGINPAFSDPAGLACFDCHSPHGNSARVLATFGAPGDIAGVGRLTGHLYKESLLSTMMFAKGSGYTAAQLLQMPDQGVIDLGPAPATIEDVNVGSNPNPVATDGSSLFGAYVGAVVAHGQNSPEAGAAAQAAFGHWYIYWAIDADKGNIVTKFWNFGSMANFTGMPWAWDASNPLWDGTTGSPNDPAKVETWKKPLYPAGKFLLLKDPNKSIVNGHETTDAALFNADGSVADNGALVTDGGIAGVGADMGKKKMGINWNKPDGPAATWGPLSMSKQNDVFPLAFPWAINGVGMENEMCADCHDGAAGSSTQKAKVWMPNSSNTATGAYVIASSHDSNPKGCARQQILNPGDANNMGPHCRNCHTGAASCNQCHGPDVASDAGMSRQNWESYYTAGTATAWDGNPGSVVPSNTVGAEGKTTYVPPAYINGKAGIGTANISRQCIDGGFSYPHRTLGASMLKDSLYGVDFNGATLAFGTTRGANATSSTIAAYFGQPATPAGADLYFGRTIDTASNLMLYPKSSLITAAGKSLINTPVDNLDSVCIDCHGDATKYQGDAAKIDKYYFPSNFDVSGNTPANHVTGWELLLKGLP